MSDEKTALSLLTTLMCIQWEITVYSHCSILLWDLCFSEALCSWTWQKMGWLGTKFVAISILSLAGNATHLRHSQRQCAQAPPLYAWTDWQVTAPDRTDDLSIKENCYSVFLGWKIFVLIGLFQGKHAVFPNMGGMQMDNPRPIHLAKWLHY